MTRHWTVLVTSSLATLVAVFYLPPVVRADIFQWEYVNPGNPTLGKQQSTILTPDGAGANAAPGTDLSYRNLAMAYLTRSNLAGAILTSSGLVNAELSQANSVNAYFGGYWESTPSEDIWHLGANLTGANLGQSELTHANFYSATLINADLSQSNLSSASFHSANMSGANLTGADVRGANFARDVLPYPIYDYAGGINLTQLYSTASYQAGELNGIGLQLNDMSNGILVGQNLANADFSFATLTGANLRQANLANASLHGAGLSGANLSQAYAANARFQDATLDNTDLRQADLTNANFGDAMLTGANLTGAVVRGAHFDQYQGGSGIHLAQLYSTASYLAHDLAGIGLFGNILAGANLAGQNLTNADMVNATLTNANLSQANLAHASFTGDNFFGVADLTGANLSLANLTDAYFGGSVSCGDIGCAYNPGANLTNANLSAADARGANFYLATLDGANSSNLIQPDGHIAGLNLTAGASLVVRDYENYAGVGISIVVDQQLVMNSSSTLRLVFDADPWNSTISFASGIPVALGGTLDLTFAPGVEIATQIGRTIDLFNWTGVTPSGAFSLESPYNWDSSQLYSTGQIRLVSALAGDFNANGTVDAADYTVWRRGLGTTYTAADYKAWKSHFGETLGSSSAGASPSHSAAPEPSSCAIAIASILGLVACIRQNRTRHRVRLA